MSRRSALAQRPGGWVYGETWERYHPPQPWLRIWTRGRAHLAA